MDAVIFPYLDASGVRDRHLAEPRALNRRSRRKSPPNGNIGKIPAGKQ